MDIRELVAEFTERLHAAVDQISVARARDAVMHALGEKRGRLPKGMAAILGRKPRRKGPRQLCPVPGCQNPAAPVFGMVCAQHKDVPKSKIKQYREARRAAKLGAKDGAGQAGQRRGKRPSPARAARSTKGDGVRARAPKNASKTDSKSASKGASKSTSKKATRGAATAKTARPAKPASTARSDGAPKRAKVEASPSAPRPPVAPPSEIAGAAP